MADVRELLAARLQDAKIRVRADPDDSEWMAAYVHDGHEAAAWLLRELDEITQGEAPADPELAAMAAIVTAMDALDGTSTALLGTDVHERVIRWAMARWNVRA